MDGASGGPRSATELAAAARGLKELLDTSLLPQDVYDARLAALKAEAAELVAAPRARSSIGDAASPAPTTVTPVAAAGADTAAVQQPSEGSAPPPPPQPSAAAAPAQPPREKRERSEAAAAAALRVLKPAPRAPPPRAQRNAHVYIEHTSDQPRRVCVRWQLQRCATLHSGLNFLFSGVRRRSGGGSTS